jgi:toxin YoeB
MYKLEFNKQADEDILSLKKSGNKQAIEKLGVLLEELREHPETGAGKPEQMKYNYVGYWSRRITRKHRLIYEILEQIDTINVIRACEHYNDK